MLVRGSSQTLPEKIPDMAENDDQQVAHVSREEDVVRRVLLRVALVLRASAVLRGVSMILVGTVAKLGVHGREDLLRGRRDTRIREAVRIVQPVLVENSVF